MSLSIPHDGTLAAHDRRRAFFRASLFALGYAPLLLLHFRRLWLDEHYHHFPLILAAVCVLGWKRSQTVAEVGHETSERTRFCGQILGLLLLASAVLLWSPWVAAVSAIIMIGGVVLGRGSRKQLAPVWLLLWLLIPLPFGWDSELTNWLQSVSSQAASTLLDLFGYDHLLAGHVIEVPGQQFLVEEACSGIRSLFLLVACAAVFAVASRRRWFHALPLIAAAMFLAMVMNVARVSAVVMLHGEAGIDVTHGWRHEALGAAIFAVAVCMLMSVDQLLEFFLAPRPVFTSEDVLLPEEDDDDDELDPAAVEPTLSIRELAHPMPHWVAVLLGLLFVGQLTLLTADGRRHPVNRVGTHEPLAGTGESSLPTEYDGWTRTSYELVTREGNSSYGQYSNTWTFQRDGETAIVSLDYPFIGWHTLINCYRGQGCSVASRQVVVATQADDPLGNAFVQVELERTTGETSLLLFSLFDRQGQPLVTPQAELSLTWSLYRLLGRVDSTCAKLGLPAPPCPMRMTAPTYQFQVLVSKPRALTDHERQQAIHLFTHARRTVLESWQGDG